MAIIVIASVSFASFSWVNQSVWMLVRSDSVLTQELLIADLLTQLEIGDLDRKAKGEIVKDGVRLEWQSQIVESGQGRTNAGGTSFYDHSLNEVTIRIFRDDLQIDDLRLFFVSSTLARQPSQEIRL